MRAVCYREEPVSAIVWAILAGSLASRAGAAPRLKVLKVDRARDGQMTNDSTSKLPLHRPCVVVHRLTARDTPLKEPLIFSCRRYAAAWFWGGWFFAVAS